MNCQICNGPLTKKTAMFCSIACKSEHQRRKVKVKSDPTKKIKCKVDGKVFDDYLNRSGSLTQYSLNFLNKPFDWSDWEVFDVTLKPTWNCPHCDWNTVDVENKSGWITTHLKDVHSTSPAEHCASFPSDTGLWKMEWIHDNKSKMLSESDHNRVMCMVCGEYMTSVTNTHLQKHNMTVSDYRIKYPNSTLISNEYSSRLRRQYYNNEKMLMTNWRSKYEDQLCEFLRSIGVEPVENYKKLGFDIDIFIPEMNVGIEFNGLYWHSQYAGGKLENYHLNKTINAEKCGVQLIHIFEDEWLERRGVIESELKRVLNKSTKVQYNDCQLVEIDNLTAQNFHRSNNPTPSSIPANINLAMINSNGIVSVMSFSELSKGVWQLLDFSNKIGVYIVDFQLMVAYFESKTNPTKLQLSLDRRWYSRNTPNVFDGIGFVVTALQPPKYYYLIDTHRRTDPATIDISSYENFDANKSEWENAIEFGIDRIWDCGCILYEKMYEKLYEKSLNESPTSPDLMEPAILAPQTTKQRVRVKREGSRNSIDVKCDICGNVNSIMGMATHLKLQHNLTVADYVNSHSEYRPDKIRLNQMLEKAGDKFKCKICQMCCTNDAHLTSHAKYVHDLTKREYVIKYIHNDILPKCKCGCGVEVSLLDQYPYYREYLSGHNSIGASNPMYQKTHSESVRQKMLDKASGRFGLDWYVEQYGIEYGTQKYENRNENLRNRQLNHQPAISATKDRLLEYVRSNPNCTHEDVVEYFKLGNASFYKKLREYFDCGNLKELKEKLNA